jgi:hypothetical protein
MAGLAHGEGAASGHPDSSGSSRWVPSSARTRPRRGQQLARLVIAERRRLAFVGFPSSAARVL